MKTLALNCINEGVSLNRKQSLLAAAERMSIKDIEIIDGDEGDYVLNIQPFNFAKGKEWTGMWHIDVMLGGDPVKYYDDVDSLFVSSPTMSDPRPWAIPLFQGIDPLLHRRLPHIVQEYDFIICGSVGEPFHKERAHTYDVLKEAGFTYKDYGKGLGPEEYVRNYNTAKVQFVRSGAANDLDGALAQRFFESLAIGPTLVNYSNDLMYTGLSEERHYLSYKNDEEMVSQMKWLLDSYNRRNNMHAAARELSLTLHTYEHRLISITNVIKDHVASN